ncbi:MAG TPA: UbiA-like polyprenyltransferase [Puia sp.]|nr:UbiA-like polyprenyltransferase [Puia sp.]
MGTIKNYLSLIKFSHTIFAMPFAMIGFFLGLRTFNTYSYALVPGWHTVIVPEIASQKAIPTSSWDLVIRFLLVILCMIFARSAAMAFNRYLDRHFDAKNPRTAIREIPKGIISANSALLFVIVSGLLFVVCCFFINSICFYLSPVALFVVLFYSYTKRFTSLCHLVLGLGLSLAPIGAYLAVTGVFSLLPVLFSLTVVFWVSGFDIIYALQDEEFDKSQQLYSMPSWLGKSKALHVSEALHLLSFVCVIAAGLLGQFGIWYWIGVCIFAGMLIYQHSIINPNDLSKVNLAFMTANGIASVVFAVFVIADLFLH